MPILTARVPAQTAQAIPQEASQPRHSLNALAHSISGPRADAILKILETLGRHLNGSEVLPREALVKLMETLARILKFPPLPQETTHDFGQRLAGFLEKLPPEARAVLEKQLGQRTLALQVRVLAQALNHPARLDAGSLRAQFQTSVVLTNPARTDIAQQARSPLPQPALPAQHLATLTAGSAPRMFGAPVEAALLQAVLRETFGAETEQAGSAQAADTDDGKSETEASAPSRRPRDNAPRTGLTQQTATLAAPRPATTTDAIPQLRAAAAFLAADPEALSLVSAIAQGEIDPQVEMTFAAQPGEEASPDAGHATSAEAEAGLQPDIDIDIEAGPTVASKDDGENQATTAEQQATETRDEKPSATISGQRSEATAMPDEADARIPSKGNEEQVRRVQPDGHSTGDEGSDNQTGDPQRAKNLSPSVDRPAEKPARILAETLKGLVQNTLPFPDGAQWETTALPRQMMTSASAGLAAGIPLHDMPGLETMLDAAAIESTAGWTAELSDEIDSWVTLADAGTEDGSETRPAWASLAKPDDALRDPLLHNRLVEGMAGRDAIPFAIIPYLPAKIDNALFAEQMEEEQVSDDGEATDGEEQDEDPATADDDEQHAAPSEPEATTDDDDTAQDAYAVYMRMGGLG
ncbi:hypothetical protein [Pararhizobium antarcticum]|nr:hypothetical protein [Pararhizobium antarcticum]